MMDRAVHRPLRAIASRLKRRFTTVARIVREHGALGLLLILGQRYLIRHLGSVLRHPAERRLKTLMAGRDPSKVLILKSTLDWAFPYRQRPHHLAQAVHELGWSVVFVTRSAGYDLVPTVSKVRNGFFLTPFLDAALAVADRPVVVLLSTDADLDADLVATLIRKDATIVYDFIDAFDEVVSSGKITERRRALHDRLVAGDDFCVCTPSADILLSDVQRHRRRHFGLIENAVDTAHFRPGPGTLEGLRADFARIVARGRPIAGYFGAFASWFDYELLAETAKRLPDVDFVLVGVNIDGTISRLGQPPENVHIVRPIPYLDLPRHARWFSVGILPFRLNGITQATSPLKLFEYFSLGLPVVSTDLPECRKYEDAMIAADAAAFAAGIRDAILHRRNAGAMARRRRLAESDSSWRHRASRILALAMEKRHSAERTADPGPPVGAAIGAPRPVAVYEKIPARG